MKCPSGSVLRGTSLIFAGLLAWCAMAQQPPPAAASPADASSSSKGKKYSHASDFLIIGTVFNDKGYAFPGVELRVRRSSEKKFRWDSYTNSRGDFAVRVPQGTDYELVVHAKGFADQARSMDAKSGVSEARLVFRMVPAKDGK